ncbi:MAG: amidohydrolase [Mariniblastus sp.]
MTDEEQTPTTKSNAEYVQELDLILSHVWMVRTFLKHSEEAEEDDELKEVHRTLYDYMLALGGPLKDGDNEKYLKQAKKKLKKLKNANSLFQEIQPEISSHTNFQMAAVSLNIAVNQVAKLVESIPKPTKPVKPAP